jgi:4-amino-4-deoxy-L-arabinose transferase-like glycosyltransferase
MLNLKSIKEWFTKRDNLLIFGVILFAIIVRLYFFFLTKNQPLWWDEAEYLLKAKNIAFGTPATGWAGAIRPIALPVFAAIFFKIGLGEFSIRFIWVILSVFNLIFIYLIGKNLFNKNVGLIASFLFSILYLDLFYTSRLLVDVPQIFFISLAAFLFTEVYFNNKNKKLIYCILPVLFLGVLFRFTVGIFAIVLLIFLFSAKGLKILKEREWYLSLGAGILTFIPYMIYSQINFGNPLQAFYFVLFGGAEGQRAANPVSVLFEYIKYFPNYTNIVLFFLFLIGAGVILFNFVIGIDKIKTNKFVQRNYLLLIWILIPLLFFGLYINHFEDRYIFMIFPAVSIISSFIIVEIFKFIRKYNVAFAVLIIALLLIFAAYTDLQRSDILIKSKLTSYEDFKDAGIYIKENSNLNDSVFSGGVPQITYYSERNTYPFPERFEDFASNISKLNVKYLVVSVLESTPNWTYSMPQNLSNSFYFAPVKVYKINDQPSTIVYKIN